MTKEVEEFLEHFGVKGMRWGVRNAEPHALDTKSLPDTKTANGETVSIVGGKAPIIARGIVRLSSRWREKVKNSSTFAMKNSEGKTVGEMSLYKKSPKELNVVWIQTNKGHAGKGYATAGMKSVIAEAKRQKLEKVTLEVPGISPNARHIYEKLGFKKNDVQTDHDPNDMWGGLTEMTLNLKNSVKHSDEEALEHFGVKGMRRGVLEQSDELDDFLEHFGVKGMRWGVKTADRPAASGDSKKFQGIKTKAKVGGVHSLTNKQLKDFNERANLERQYQQLNPSVKKKVLDFTVPLLLGVGKQQVMKLATDVATKQIANLLKK